MLANKKGAPFADELVENWAAVRVFPTPSYSPNYAGPREDYRETVFWAPSVKTDSKGKATVKFALSDAVTSFRIFSEGTGGGAIGRDERVFKTSLPFSLSVKIISLVEKAKKEKINSEEKEVKVSSKEQTFRLFKEGMSMKEIAAVRGFAITTLESHLTPYVSSGEINIDKLVSEEKQKIILIDFGYAF